MNVLMIGGSGIVGSLVAPLLAESHTLRIFDMRPPQTAGFDYHQGDVTQYADLLAAMTGMEAVLYMAMGSLDWTATPGIVSAYDVNVKGLHLALRAANEAGITQAVYASTMSIYAGNLMQRFFADEELTADASDLYGFTKYLGEQVCLNATRLWGMNINALRLCLPKSEADWLAEVSADVPFITTTAQDVTRAVDAALKFKAGFQAFMISGDYENKIMNMSKAKRLLGWEPLARPNK
jgi:nucleoside-diphosphate-sugar epimerase